jgi:type I restriction enzyme S subunit
VNLPASWQQAQLGSLLIALRNGTTAIQNKSGIGTPITRIETISDGYIDAQRVGWLKNIRGVEQYILQRGDILHPTCYPSSVYFCQSTRQPSAISRF